MDKELILSIPLSTCVQDDSWTWHYDKKGVFIVQSAYRLLVATKNQWGIGLSIGLVGQIQRKKENRGQNYGMQLCLLKFEFLFGE
jgi:hypothetical protein